MLEDMTENRNHCDCECTCESECERNSSLRSEMMMQLRAYKFSIIELGLYLEIGRAHV